MTVVRSERLAGQRSGMNGFGDDPHAAVKSVEGEIREFVRRDASFARRARPAAADDAPAENVNILIRQVSGASMEEIDRVILELQGVREMLRDEGERITRELAGYASLNHAAMTSMKIIAESVAQWKNGSPAGPG